METAIHATQLHLNEQYDICMFIDNSHVHSLIVRFKSTIHVDHTSDLNNVVILQNIKLESILYISSYSY